jgi:hypothetical protein
MLAEISASLVGMSCGAPGGSICEGSTMCTAGTQNVADSPASFIRAATSVSAPSGSFRSHRPMPSPPVAAMSSMSCHTVLCGSEVALTA